MKIKLLFEINHGKEHSRFLVKKDDNFYSILVDSTFAVNDFIDLEEATLEETKEIWIERYEKGFSSYRIKKHLQQYKKTNAILMNLPNGLWEGKEYGHILPENQKYLNLINSSYKDKLLEIYKEIDTRKELHEGFANLNSSQAFAINFYGPIIEENLFGILFEKSGINIINSKFEKTFDEEEASQIDFYCESENEGYIAEVKYSENNFGDAVNNTNHQTKFDKIYKYRLSKVIDNISIEDFFEEYQLWRNICFAAENKNVYFVFPRFRKDLTEIVNNAIKKCKDEIKPKIHIIHVDDFFEKMINSPNNALSEHYLEFKRKYLDL